MDILTVPLMTMRACASSVEFVGIIPINIVDVLSPSTDFLNQLLSIYYWILHKCSNFCQVRTVFCVKFRIDYIYLIRFLPVHKSQILVNEDLKKIQH